MNTSKHFLALLAASTLMASSSFAAESSMFGAVNFATVLSESKHGKKEQVDLQNLQKEMAQRIENSDKEIKELEAKLEDTEYLEGLSPKAEEDLKIKYQTLQEDLGRYQNQFYQIMQQAQYQIYQKIAGNIAKASEKVADQKKIDYVINREACFFIRPELDVTQSIIQEMDKMFDTEQNQKAKKLSENGEDLSLQGTDEVKKAG